MGRYELRQAIFNLVEFLNNYEVSQTAQKLIIHYFNDSKLGTSYERALEAVLTYVPGALDGDVRNSQKVIELLDRLKREADRWDLE